jgi:hypothetical protein
VSKKALGRGLGQLLPEQSKAPATARHDYKVGSPVDSGTFGPGLRVLIAQKSGSGSPVRIQNGGHPELDLSLVKLTLVFADLLTSLTTVIWFSRLSAPNWKEVLICSGAISVGAWFGGLAAWLEFRTKL